MSDAATNNLKLLVVHRGSVVIKTEDDEDPAPATTFTCFPILPIATRLAIWNESMESRIVKVESVRRRVKTLRFVTSMPAILHCNRESRAEGLKLYKLSFEDEYYCANSVYFNPKLDILSFSTWSFAYELYRKMKKQDLDMVENLTVPATHQSTGFDMGLFPALKQLFMTTLVEQKHNKAFYKEHLDHGERFVEVETILDVGGKWRHKDQDGRWVHKQPKDALDQAKTSCKRLLAEFERNNPHNLDVKGLDLRYVILCGHIARPQRKLKR